MISNLFFLSLALLINSWCDGFAISSHTNSNCMKSTKLMKHTNYKIPTNNIGSNELKMFSGDYSTINAIALNSPLLLSDISSNVEYSKLSLYFTLALYILSVPGLFSLVSRSVKVKPVQKQYDIPGPANPTSKPLRQTAGEIAAYFKAMNYEINAAEEVITFTGVMGKSKSQAAFLTFCTFMALGSFGLVLSILIPELGSNAYLVTLLSPYAGIYYWKNAQSVNEVKVKMETSDDNQITAIIAQGGKEDLERFSKTLNLAERGKVYVKGIFEAGDGNDSDAIIGTGTEVVTIPTGNANAPVVEAVAAVADSSVDA